MIKYYLTLNCIVLYWISELDCYNAYDKRLQFLLALVCLV